MPPLYFPVGNWPIDEVNQDLKQRIGYHVISISDQILSKSLDYAIASIEFDKAKFNYQKALEWVNDSGVAFASIADGDKEVKATVRDSEDFDPAAGIKKIDIGDGVTLQLRKLKDELTAAERKTVEEVLKAASSEDLNSDGSFKGGFDGCVQHMQDSKGLDVESARKLCAFIGRRAGKIKAAKSLEAPVEQKTQKSEFKVVKQEGDTVQYELSFPIYKASDEQIVHGIVYEPDVVDAQGDSASPEEIRKAAHNFMADSRKIGHMHKADASEKVRILENFVAPVPYRDGKQMIRKGTWVMVLKIVDPELWGDVKSGKITGLSMGGKARAAGNASA